MKELTLITRFKLTNKINFFFYLRIQEKCCNKQRINCSESAQIKPERSTHLVNLHVWVFIIKEIINARNNVCTLKKHIKLSEVDPLVYHQYAKPFFTSLTWEILSWQRLLRVSKTRQVQVSISPCNMSTTNIHQSWFFFF